MNSDTLSFVLPKNKSHAIKVIGVGGGGSNAVEFMYNQRIEGVDFIVCNTDAQALKNSPVPVKIQLGVKLTEGMGAGSNPDVGYKAALESKETIREVLSAETKLVFITAGMGGGTGTGAAPVIAEIARELDLLIVGIVTLPFKFEGEKQMKKARRGINNLRKFVDALVIINNNKLIDIYGDLGITEGFAKADEVLSDAAKGIAGVINDYYKRNIDLNDAKTVLSNSGNALMGSATSSGADRAKKVVSDALASPLLDDNKIKGASKVLLLIISGKKEVTFNEINDISNHLIKQAGGKVDIILGLGKDESLEDAISVTVIATGFPGGIQEEIEHTEKNKIVYTLDDEQSVQMDLFSANERSYEYEPFEENPEKIVHNLEENEEKEADHNSLGIDISPDEVSEIEVDFSEMANTFTEKTGKADEIENGQIPGTGAPFDLAEIEVEYEEIELSVQTGIEEYHQEAVSSKQMELSFEFNESAGQEKDNPPPKIIHRLTDEDADSSQNDTTNSTEKENTSADDGSDFVKIEKPVDVDTELFEENTQEYSPNNMTIEEFKKTAKNRKRLWKENHNHLFDNHPGNIENLENEPAYKRRGVILDNPTAFENDISRTSLDTDENGDIQFSTDNPFLHDNVD